MYDLLAIEGGKAIVVIAIDLIEPKGFGRVRMMPLRQITQEELLSFVTRSVVGPRAYQNGTRLLITADAGGPNGYRTRLWKVELAKLANVTGVELTVCHFPPGTQHFAPGGIDYQSALGCRVRPL